MLQMAGTLVCVGLRLTASEAAAEEQIIQGFTAEGSRTTRPFAVNNGWEARWPDTNDLVGANRFLNPQSHRLAEAPIESWNTFRYARFLCVTQHAGLIQYQSAPLNSPKARLTEKDIHHADGFDCLITEFDVGIAGIAVRDRITKRHAVRAEYSERQRRLPAQDVFLPMRFC